MFRQTKLIGAALTKITLCAFCVIAQDLIFASNNAASQIEGVNGLGQRWAYEFHRIPETAKCSLLDANTGMVVFQNPDWIVKAAISSETAAGCKTNLLFFDSKTLRLVASVGVPNMVVSLGVLPERSVFYVLVSTQHNHFKFRDPQPHILPIYSRLLPHAGRPPPARKTPNKRHSN